MSIADAIAQQPKMLPGPRCSTCLVIDTLDAADREALAMAMADPSVTASTIARALQSDGHDVSVASITRHRRKGCAKR